MKTTLTLFLEAYIKAALWSSTDDNDKPLDDNYTVADISGELLDQMIEDCGNFMAKADLPEELLAQAGHDFWLTRNGHGTGFWDKAEVYGEQQAEDLTIMAEAYKVVDLYVGDDGRIYA